MQGWKGRSIAVAAILMLGLGGMTAGANDAEAELRTRIDKLEQELQEVRAELAAGRSRERTGPATSDGDQELARRLEVLAAEIERLKLGESAPTASAADYGFGPAASKVYRSGTGVSLGGYGEMVYQNYADEREDGSKVDRASQLDFLRAIVYFGYKFDDRWLFNSEVEFEHGSTGSDGSVSVEFAYLDYRWRQEANLRAGMLLVPMGHLNELHEPTTFLSTLRPETERTILPSTWRENGIGLYGDLGAISYRTYLMNGFDADGFSAAGLRGGRQNGARALAEGLAWVARIDHERPGLVVGGAVYAGRSGQGAERAAPEVTTRILEAHLSWRHRGWWVRALAAQAHVDDVAALNEMRGLEGSASVAERLRGGYLEIGYDVLPKLTGGGHGQASLTPFVRWESVDTQSQVPAGFERNPANDQRLWTLGVAFRPIDQIVFKADYRNASNDAETALDQFNLSLGYIF